MFSFKSLDNVGRRDIPLGEESSDDLDISPYADGLRHFIQSCETPMTVGIQGEWGSGKTSLMKLVRAGMKADNEASVAEKAITFWFETWQYGAMGSAETLGLHLMQDLSNRLLRQLDSDNPVSYRFAEGMKSFLSKAVPAVASGTISAVTQGLVDGSKVVEGVAGRPVGTEDMRKKFQELVSAALAKDDTYERVVVFVDDLDRIQPGLAVRLLEVLKNFMDVEGCVFVVACDYEVVRQGVRELMKIEEKDKVEAFFHKIFQVPFNMPIGAYTIDKLFRSYVTRKLVSENPSIGAGKKGGGGKNAHEKAVGRFLEARFSDHSTRWFDALTQLVESAVGTNPRGFKRFLNVVDLTCCVDAAFCPNAEAAIKDPGALPLASWELKSETPAGNSATVQWLMTLFPVVALQIRWPEVAPYLLQEVTEQFSIELVDGTKHKMTQFERKLRTLVQSWPEGATACDDTQSNDYEDELLLELLREAYGTDGRTDSEVRDPRCGRVEQLERFCRDWYELLNHSDDQDVLTPQELGLLGRWSSRLGRMGTNQAQPRGIVAFQRTCSKMDASAGDGFAALSALVIHTIKSRELAYLKAASNKAEEFRVWAKCPNGSEQVLIAMMARNQSLEIRLFIREDAARKRQMFPLSALGQALLNEWAEAKLEDTHVSRTNHEIRIDYMAWHRNGDKGMLRTIFADFLYKVDSLCEAIEGEPSLGKDPNAVSILTTLPQSQPEIETPLA